MASVVTLITKKTIFLKIISDLPTLIFSRYETGTTGIFLGLSVGGAKFCEIKFVCAHLFQVVELKKELQERGLNISGNKSDLIARLEEYILKQGMV
jgi:hypothetical protein